MRRKNIRTLSYVYLRIWYDRMNSQPKGQSYQALRGPDLRTAFCRNSFQSTQDAVQCNTSLSKFEPVFLSVRHCVGLIRHCYTPRRKMAMATHRCGRLRLRREGALLRKVPWRWQLAVWGEGEWAQKWGRNDGDNEYDAYDGGRSIRPNTCIVAGGPIHLWARHLSRYIKC
jgi:hypothetical protein